MLFGTYLLGAAALATLVLAGGSIPLVWLSIGFIGAFVYEESSLLQALLAEVAPTELRDVASSAYFALMSVVGAIWSAALGVLVGVLGDARGFPVAFGVMAVSCSHRGGALDPGRSVTRRVRARPSRRAGSTPGLEEPADRVARPAVYSASPVKRAPSVGAWRSLVARIVRDDEVGGSNPLAPTSLTHFHPELPAHCGRPTSLLGLEARVKPDLT